MPPEGPDWLPGPDLLSDDEVVRLISIAVNQLGITEVRFTGGEPCCAAACPASSPAPRP